MVTDPKRSVSTFVDIDPLREVSELLGVLVLAVERLEEPPRRFRLTVSLPAGHHLALLAGSAVVRAYVPAATFRNPRRLALWAGTYGGGGGRLTADDGHRVVRLLYATTDPEEKEIDRC